MKKILETSGKSQGILSEEKSGNPAMSFTLAPCTQVFICAITPMFYTHVSHPFAHVLCPCASVSCLHAMIN